MANETIGEIELELGGAKRTLTFTCADFIQIEALLDIRRGEKTSFLRFVGQIGSWTTQDFGLMIWTGLHDSTLQEEDVLKLMSMRTLLEAQMKFGEWANSMIPESLKKKAATLQAEMAQTNGRRPGETVSN